MRIWRSGVTAVLLAAAVGCGAASAGSAQPVVPAAAVSTSSGPIKILTFNLCGEHCNADRTGGNVAQLMSTVDTNQPNVVFLQEACRKQYNALKSLSTQPDHWLLYGYTDVTEPHGCDGGDDSFGDAILTHTPLARSTVATKALPYVHGHGVNRQVRKVLCEQTDALPRPAELCTSHLGLSAEIGTGHQTTQVHDVYAFARAQGSGVPLVLAGDFNVVPAANALDAVYFTGGGGAHGAMQEADACSAANGGRTRHSASCNSYTHGAAVGAKLTAKNDYIFGSRKSFRSLSGTVLSTSYSDHKPLLGTMYLCATGDC